MSRYTLISGNHGQNQVLSVDITGCDDAADVQDDKEYDDSNQRFMNFFPEMGRSPGTAGVLAIRPVVCAAVVGILFISTAMVVAIRRCARHKAH